MYSISDLEQLSGIQSHTIRMWERRYKVLTPHRSTGNTRYYDDEQLVRLLNIVSANQTGLKIAQISALSDEAIKAIIAQQITETVAVNQKTEYYITQLLAFGMLYNEASFSDLLCSCIKNYGLKHTYVNVIYPMLVRLGLMWRKDSICAAQEHFLTHMIRQKIASATDALPLAKNKKATWLLFLPEHEQHDIGLLFANYLLRQANANVIYLGANVPLTALSEVVEKNKIDNMLLFMLHHRLPSSAQKYIDILAQKFEDKSIKLAGNNTFIASLQLPQNVKKIQTVDDFDRMINEANDN